MISGTYKSSSVLRSLNRLNSIKESMKSALLSVNCVSASPELLGTGPGHGRRLLVVPDHAARHLHPLLPVLNSTLYLQNTCPSNSVSVHNTHLDVLDGAGVVDVALALGGPVLALEAQTLTRERVSMSTVLSATSSSHLTRSAAWSPSRTARASPPSASPPSPPRAAGGSARSSGSRDTAPADVDCGHSVYAALSSLLCVYRIFDFQNPNPCHDE